jgi:DnaJ-class molecular chaperone
MNKYFIIVILLLDCRQYYSTLGISEDAEYEEIKKAQIKVPGYHY